MSSLPVEYSIAPAPLGRDPYGERRPPWSEDAEQAVLAAMLIDSAATSNEEAVDRAVYRRPEMLLLLELGYALNAIDKRVSKFLKKLASKIGTNSPNPPARI